MRMASGMLDPLPDEMLLRRVPRFLLSALAALAAAACLAHQAVVAAPQRLQPDVLEYAPTWGWHLPSASRATDDRRGDSGSALYSGVQSQPQSERQSPSGTIQYSTAPRQQQQPQQQLSPPGTLQYSTGVQQPQQQQQQQQSFSTRRQQYPLESGVAGAGGLGAFPLPSSAAGAAGGLAGGLAGGAPGLQHAVGRPYGALDSAAGTLDPRAPAAAPGLQPLQLGVGHHQVSAAGQPGQASAVPYHGWPSPAAVQPLLYSGHVLPGAQPGQALGQQGGQPGQALGQQTAPQWHRPGGLQADSSPGDALGAFMALLGSKAAMLGSAVRGGVQAVLWLPGVILDALRGVQTPG